MVSICTERCFLLRGRAVSEGTAHTGAEQEEEPEKSLENKARFDGAWRNFVW